MIVNPQTAFLPWTLAQQAISSIPQNWNNTFGKNNILGHQFPEKGIDPNVATVIGGICSLFTGESEAIRKGVVTFANVEDFKNWIFSWYPRKDQVFNVVGTPPKAVKKIYYVVEDSIFARRTAKWTNLPVGELEEIFYEVHKQKGVTEVEKHLALSGWKGELIPIYTSKIVKEHTTALKIWERLMGKRCQPNDRDISLITLMYTGLWADVLGIYEPVVIYEPEDHMSFSENVPGFIRNWFNKNQYGKDGINRNVGIIGCKGYHQNGESTRRLRYDELQ